MTLGAARRLLVMVAIVSCAVAGCFRHGGTEARETRNAAPGTTTDRATIDQKTLEELQAANSALDRKVEVLEARLAERQAMAPVRAAAGGEPVRPSAPRVEEVAPAVGQSAAASTSGEPAAPLDPETAIADLPREAPLGRDEPPMPYERPAWTPRPEDRRPAQPEPEPVIVTVAAATPFELTLLDPLSTRENQPGDRFAARLTTDLVAIDGTLAVPSGAEVTGRITELASPGKIGGRASLALELETVVLAGGESYPLAASWSARTRSRTKKDAATIGGATVGGALLGRIFDKGEGTLLGGLLGAAAGTAIARQRDGEEIELATGDALELELAAPLQVEVERPQT